jgi:replicative DNA helicase
VIEWRQYWRVRLHEERAERAKREAAASEETVARLQAEIDALLKATKDNSVLTDDAGFRAIMSSLARARAEAMTTEPWGPPAPLVTARDLPPFPVAGLPPTLRAMATEVAESVQVPVDLVAPLILSALSGALCGRVWVKPRPGWEELVALYFLGLLDSGNRKSSLHAASLGPLYAAQTKMRDEVREPRQDALLSAQMADALAKRAKADAVKSGLPDDIEAWKRAERYAQSCHAAVPPEPLLITQDATPEALASLMKRNGERVVISSAEGGALITILGGRYTAQSYIDLLLSGHVGEPFSQNRQTRDAVVLERPAITIAVVSQPETMRELLEVGGSTKRGLMARFLIAAPVSLLGTRKVETTPVSFGTAGAYAGLLGTLVDALWGTEKRTTLTVSDDGTVVLDAYRAALEARYLPAGDLASVPDFGGKLAGSAVRLAALHHVGTFGSRFWEPISAESIAWGIEVAEWSLHHYRYAMTVAGQVSEIAHAERMRALLVRHPDRLQWSKRDLTTELRLTAEQADAALEQLRTAGCVRPVLPDKGRRGPGRPSERWDVNPALLAPGVLLVLPRGDPCCICSHETERRAYLIL